MTNIHYFVMRALTHAQACVAAQNFASGSGGPETWAETLGTVCEDGSAWSTNPDNWNAAGITVASISRDIGAAIVNEGYGIDETSDGYATLQYIARGEYNRCNEDGLRELKDAVESLVSHYRNETGPFAASDFDVLKQEYKSRDVWELGVTRITDAAESFGGKMYVAIVLMHH